jgi:hypothetical protein
LLLRLLASQFERAGCRSAALALLLRRSSRSGSSNGAVAA